MRTKQKILVILALFAITLTSLFAVRGGVLANAFPSGVNVIPSEKADAAYTGISNDRLSLNISNLDRTKTEASFASGVSFRDSPNRPGELCVTVTHDRTDSGAWSKEGDICTLYYSNVGQINGKDINASITFSDLKAGARYAALIDTDMPDDQLSIAIQRKSFLAVWGAEDYPSRRPLQISTSIKITWADSGDGYSSVVNAPFFFTGFDIDAGSPTTFRESLEFKNGFTGDFYAFDTCELIKDGNKFATPFQSTDGKEQLTVTGVFATANNGNMTLDYYGGVCSTGLYVSSPDSLLKPSSKTVNKSTFHPGDTAVWKTTWTMPNMYVERFSPLKSLVITDPLPVGLEYSSARVLLGSTDVTKTAGTLSYDSDSRTVKFTFNSTFLNNAANNNAQSLVFEVTTKVSSEAPDTIKNTATVQPDSYTKSASASASVVKPGITLTKTVDKPSIDIAQAKPGTVLNYTFTMENTGNTKLTDASITDELPGISEISYEWSGAAGEMSVGETQTATATYTLTQEDIDRGYVTNPASVEAQDEHGSTVTDDASVKSTITQSPAIDITKTTDTPTIDDAEPGDAVTFTIKIANTGNVTLSEVTLDDPMCGGKITLPVTALAPGEATTAKVTYELTQDDIDAGEMINTATASGTAPDGDEVTDTASDDVTIPESPKISIVKTADEKTIDDAKVGDEVSFSLNVTNSGNVTLSDIAVDDPQCGGNVTMPKTELAPGESMTATVGVTLTQEMIDSGSLSNTASATGTSPRGTEVESESTDDVTFAASPSISIVKSPSTTKIEDPNVGDEIEYDFTIANTGNVTLHDVTLTDTLLGGDMRIGKTTLAPGEKTTASGSYSVTQADIDAGHRSNTATTTGTAPNDKVVTATDDADVALQQNPSLVLDKSASRTHIAYAHAGDQVTYTLIVTNTGNVTLSSGDIVDDMLGGSLAGKMDKKVLLPGEKARVDVTYDVTQDDIDRGVLENTATTSWKDPNGDDVTGDDDVTIDIDRHPSISLEKTVDGDAVIENAHVGDFVDFTLTVTNTGNVTLTDVSLLDVLDGVELDTSETATELAPGEVTKAHARYQLTQKDIDKGDVTNLATVSANPPTGLDPVTDDGEAKVDTPEKPSIDIDKASDMSIMPDALPGDVVTYTMTVTNTGNVTLSDVTIDDPMLGGVMALEKTELLPGESTSVTKEYHVTQEDIDNGRCDNVATARGKSPHGTNVEDDDTVGVEIPQTPRIDVVKEVRISDESKDADSLRAGDELTYTFVIGNTGNTTLSSITLFDELLGGDVSIEGGIKGIDMSLLDRYASKDDGSSADTAGDENADGNDDESVKDENEDNRVDTDADDAEDADAGTESAGGEEGANEEPELPEHDYSVTHAEPDENLPFDSLRPGETITIEVPYKITQDDKDAAEILNVCEATGVSPAKGDGSEGESVSDTDDAHIELPSHPSITLKKTANVSDITDAVPGDEIAYDLEITNVGDISLKDFTLTDELEGIELDASALDGAILAPDGTLHATATYGVSADDIENGAVNNHAKVTASSVTPVKEGEAPQEVSAEDEVNVLLFANDEGVASTLIQTGAGIGGVAVATGAAAAVAAYAIHRRKLSNM